jgi:cytidylate kinase
MDALLQRIELLIKARYPLVQLVTHEEARIERALERMANDNGLRIHRWRCSTGLDSLPDAGETADPVMALEALADEEEPGLFLFFDLHPFIEEPDVVRRLRDSCARMGSRQQAIVLIGPDPRIPHDVEKEVVSVDVPLPGRVEVSRLLAVLLKKQGLEVPPNRFERFVQGSLGLTEDEIKRLYARILIGGDGFSAADLVTLNEDKAQVIRRTRVLEYWDVQGAGDAVGGLDNLKGWLAQRRMAFSPDAREAGLPEPRGVFMLGVQGCGKSLMAKAVADAWQIPLLRLDVGAVFQGSSTGGGSAGQRLRDTVRVAETLAPVVLWIDEIEKGFLSQKDAGGGEAFGTFLTWMQEKKAPVFVVATANEVRMLPPELLRKGRFDEIFFVDLPNVHERLAILEIHLRRCPTDTSDFDLPLVAEETERFSGAELAEVVTGAMFAAYAEGRPVESIDLLEVAREMVPLAITMDDRIKELREWARPRARPASLDRRRIDFFEEWEEVS